MDYFSNPSYSSHHPESPLSDSLDSFLPVSNLPTPPLGSAASTPPEEEFSEIDPAVLAPAIHIANLVPPSAARSRLSPGLVAEYLTRARLSLHTLAFAACLLNSLSSRFVRTWRSEIMTVLTTESASQTSKSSHRRSRSSWGTSVVHWKAELIVLAALQISSSFLDDVQSSARWWADAVAQRGVTARELDASIRAVLQDIGYDLCSFQSEDVQRMGRIMQRGQHQIDVVRAEKGDEWQDY